MCPRRHLWRRESPQPDPRLLPRLPDLGDPFPPRPHSHSSINGMLPIITITTTTRVGGGVASSLPPLLVGFGLAIIVSSSLVGLVFRPVQRWERRRVGFGVRWLSHCTYIIRRLVDTVRTATYIYIYTHIYGENAYVCVWGVESLEERSWWNGVMKGLGVAFICVLCCVVCVWEERKGKLNVEASFNLTPPS